MARDLVSNVGLNQSARRAIEALRNGVPNRDAVAALGSNQPNARRHFSELLDKVEGSEAVLKNTLGMLFSGDFGTGKSHLLSHFEHLALERKFVCSKVPISKETPLYDLGKVFSSAMENGRMPERQGRLVEELARAINPNTEKYTKLFQWAFREAKSGRLHPIFPASLSIYERALDHELNSDLEAFWSGEKIQITKIRKGLRGIGETDMYGKFRAPNAAELPRQRMRFIVELMKASGYRGWIILLDEIELVGFYSILQRGRSYAEIAYLLGIVPEEQCPGMIVVGAVTDDFSSAIISPDGGKKDLDYIRPKLENSARHSNLVNAAAQGMRLLMNECMPLEQAVDSDVRNSISKLRDLYGKAYGVAPPPYEIPTGGAGFQGRMRHKVRAAINEWDLHRLKQDYQPDMVVDEFVVKYDENTDLEREDKEDAR